MISLLWLLWLLLAVLLPIGPTAIAGASPYGRRARHHLAVARHAGTSGGAS